MGQVTAGTSDAAVLERPLARFGQAHQRIGTEPEIPAASLNHKPLHPGFRDPSLALGPDYTEDQSMLVVVLTEVFDDAHKCDSELLSQIPIPVSVPLSERD